MEREIRVHGGNRYNLLDLVKKARKKEEESSCLEVKSTEEDIFKMEKLLYDITFDNLVFKFRDISFINCVVGGDKEQLKNRKDYNTCFRTSGNVYLSFKCTWLLRTDQNLSALLKEGGLDKTIIRFFKKKFPNSVSINVTWEDIPILVTKNKSTQNISRRDNEEFLLYKSLHTGTLTDKEIEERIKLVDSTTWVKKNFEHIKVEVVFKSKKIYEIDYEKESFRILKNMEEK
ncbi:MAG: hypothetical protein WC942_10615 [Clostridia bacterium]|jgi:hypothetical protein